jgi:hypothetical protein
LLRINSQELKSKLGAKFLAYAGFLALIFKEVNRNYQSRLIIKKHLPSCAIYKSRCLLNRKQNLNSSRNKIPAECSLIKHHSVLFCDKYIRGCLEITSMRSLRFDLSVEYLTAKSA